MIEPVCKKEIGSVSEENVMKEILANCRFPAFKIKGI